MWQKEIRVVISLQICSTSTQSFRAVGLWGLWGHLHYCQHHTQGRRSKRALGTDQPCHLHQQGHKAHSFLYPLVGKLNARRAWWQPASWGKGMNSHQTEVTQPVTGLKCFRVLDPTAPTPLWDEVCGLKGVRLEITVLCDGMYGMEPGTLCSGDLSRKGIEWLQVTIPYFFVCLRQFHVSQGGLKLTL